MSDVLGIGGIINTVGPRKPQPLRLFLIATAEEERLLSEAAVGYRSSS